MRHWGLSGVLAASLAGFMGCGWLPGPSSSSSTGGVAVVDLDEVAKSVGANALLNDMVKMREANLNNALGKASTELKDELQVLVDELKTEYDGKDVPQAEAKKLQQQTITANAKLQQFRSQAQVDLNNYTEQLKQQFRAEVRPLAQEIATKKGFSIVIPKNDGLLLSVAPGNDITNDVILALQARNQKKGTEAKPQSQPQTEAAAKPTKKKSEEKKTAEVPTKEKTKTIDEN